MPTPPYELRTIPGKQRDDDGTVKGRLIHRSTSRRAIYAAIDKLVKAKGDQVGYSVWQGGEVVEF